VEEEEEEVRASYSVKLSPEFSASRFFAKLFSRVKRAVLEKVWGATHVADRGVWMMGVVLNEPGSYQRGKSCPALRKNGGVRDEVRKRNHQMNTEIKNREIMVGRVLALLAQPEIVLPIGAQAMVTTLGTLKSDLETFGGGQVAAGAELTGGIVNRVETAKALRADVRTVSNLAKRMDPVQFPGVAGKFQAPRSSSFTALENAARAIVEDMEPPVREIFADRLGQPLLDRIPVLLAQFEVNTGQKNAGRNGRVAATTDLEATAARALALVRELDPIVRSTLRDRPGLLAAWKSASRVERRRSEPAVPSPTPPPAPVVS
jgi:hypothetical protein